jgi:Na+/proline symporter
MAGGAGKVVDLITSRDMLRFWPEPTWHEMLFFFGAAITMMLGSIPQQDVFQRVMSANTEKAATHGTVIGGSAYILFAFVPMFLVASALLIMPEQAAELLQEDPQKVLPTLVMTRMPLVMQVLFFGALLSAIKSCASATLLAPSVTFTENIWRQFRPEHISDREKLLTMRISVLVFAAGVLVYSIKMEGTPIYELVSSAYQVPLVGAFVPLVFGLYWKRATTQGALCATVLGIGVWVLFMATPALHEAFPQQLAGVLAAMIATGLPATMPSQAWSDGAHPAENEAHPIIEGFSQAPFPPVCLSMPTNAAPVAMPRMCCKKSPMPR